jgi:acetyl esterase/lipase
MKRCCLLLITAILPLADVNLGLAAAVKTMTYKTVGTRALQIHLHFPKDWQAADRRPAMVFFFGGGWNGGRVEQFLPQAEYFASRGMVTARADYRVKSRDGVTPDQCVADARSAVRWLRAHARELGMDPRKLVASGGSAGGHLAACMMIEQSVESPGDDRSISTVPQAMVLYNPVLSFEHDKLRPRLGDKQHLARAISPLAHLSAKTPPALILFGTEDPLKAFGEAYRAQAQEFDVRVEEYFAEGQGHGFFNRSPWLERTTRVVDQFLLSLRLLTGEPAVTPMEPARDRNP